MTTDGGGYMLIGRMNDSVTWDVPSDNTTIAPFGAPQWSSSFGDIAILDFRVQVAADEEYKQIKAHWYVLATKLIHIDKTTVQGLKSLNFRLSINKLNEIVSIFTNF